MTRRLQVDDIGLGSVHTWHGTPDARVRGTDVVWRRASENKIVVEDVVSEEEGSDGATTEVEGKVLATEVNLVQAIATCVVASFTAKSRHPEKQTLVWPDSHAALLRAPGEILPPPHTEGDY